MIRSMTRSQAVKNKTGKGYSKSDITHCKGVPVARLHHSQLPSLFRPHSLSRVPFPPSGLFHSRNQPVTIIIDPLSAPARERGQRVRILSRSALQIGTITIWIDGQNWKGQLPSNESNRAFTGKGKSLRASYCLLLIDSGKLEEKGSA